MRYQLYGLMSLLLIFNLTMQWLGGAWLWVGFVAAIFLATFVDEAAGSDKEITRGAAPVRLLNGFLFATLPMVVLNSLGLALLLRQGETPYYDLIGGALALGLFLGAAGVNVAHELVHRTASAFSMAVGRALLAFTFDTSFAIEHVYGHHNRVATLEDPATARRGENLFAFFWRALKDGNISAWHIETARLQRKGLRIWSLQNRFLIWQFASVVVVAVWWMIAGWAGVLTAMAVGALGKFMLEGVDYIEHYGLVRVPGQPVEPRHSWNCYQTVTNRLLYNLGQHSNHHRFAGKPFWNLEIEPAAPQMPHGYMTMILLALVPPLWRIVMNPLLTKWDETMATPQERALVAR